MKYDVIVIGAGFAGATMAQQYHAIGKKVLVLEKRNHIAGNMFDFIDQQGVRYHQYGPHIFHTVNTKVTDYLSQFTSWYDYEHRVLGFVEDKFVPIPFNLKSIEDCFGAEQAERLKSLLLSQYPEGTKVPILTLRENPNEEIRALAEFIYEHVFKYYTMKQWGLSPEEIDPHVTARVPVLLSYDDRYFQAPFQKMPKEGYTALFNNMLDGVEVRLNTDCKSLMRFVDGVTYFEDSLFEGVVVYTGAVDELLDYKYGALPYRSLEFKVEHYDTTFQPTATVNYPTDQIKHSYTRITEYKWMMEKQQEKTTIAIEYPKTFEPNSKDIPYYPIFTKANQVQYELYHSECKKYENMILLGRLAEYRYYDMDAIVLRALNVFQSLNK